MKDNSLNLIAWGETVRASKHYIEPCCDKCDKKIKIKETSYTLRRNGVPDYGLYSMCEDCYRDLITAK